ncbi:thioesterase family protein [Haloechinothrix sp. LS1_15]|uniref:acyl-CoA thioesterase n=1 Tax=Haloechinothrix sp. LS1_15 TaxID=2652248 RepID=UPI00294AF0E6|nr:thioesterase family protein [Haloechinothrix sp. LS1_15]
MTTDGTEAPHVFHCPLRWSDMDAAGHVHNVAFLRYLEEARIDMLGVCAGKLGAESLVTGAVVAQLRIDYRRPLAYRPDPVRIDGWVSRIGNSSYDLVHDIVDGEAHYAHSTATIVAYDLTEGRPRRLSERERAALGELGHPGAGEQATGHARAARPRGDDAVAAEAAGAAPHRHRIQLRRADMDAYGHVNNVVYLTYIDEARQEMLAGLGQSGDLSEKLVVADHTITYLTPLVYRPGQVEVTSTVQRIGESSFTLQHEVRDETTSYCRATSVLVAFDPVAGISRAITPAERAELTRLS